MFSSNPFKQKKYKLTGGIRSGAPVPTPYAYWSMDTVDLTGATLADNGTEGLDATLVGDTSLVAGGQVNEEADFDGTGDYITVPTFLIGPGGVSDPIPFSVSVWATWDSLQENSRIIDFARLTRGTILDNITLYNSGTTGDLSLTVYENITPGPTLQAVGSIITGTRMHIVATISLTGDASIYVNGSLATNGAVEPVRSIIRSSNYIGRSNFFGASSDQDFDGKIDELAIWDVELGQSQVTDLYKLGNNGNRIVT